MFDDMMSAGCAIRPFIFHLPYIHILNRSDLYSPQWPVASLFILCVGMSMAELASAAPTSGGVSHTVAHSPAHRDEQYVI